MRICDSLFREPALSRSNAEQESIPLADVAWRPGTLNRFVKPARQAGKSFTNTGSVCVGNSDPDLGDRANAFNPDYRHWVDYRPLA
jgi:hypothetical protein